MRITLISLLLLVSVYSFSEFAPPKGFHLVRADNGTGELDEYTNGKYTFITHKPFRDYNFIRINDSVSGYLSRFFGFPFHITQDSLCWGTGRRNGVFCYVVVGYDGELVDLYSATNDKGFDFYSKWLLSTARDYKQKGRSLIFRMHMH